jgi:hypothetical protein
MGDDMALSGGCHCGAIRYQLEGNPKDVALCHCIDCRKNSGAPVMVWAGYPETSLKVTKGKPKIFASSKLSQRSFCGDCGTGLFFRNAELLPGLVEVQSSTLDDPEQLAPTLHIQVAERLNWMKRAHELPEIERFPE